MIFHYPVMRSEVIELLEPQNREGVFLDATLGGGGHSELILESSPKIRLLGIDRDPEAIDYASLKLKPFKDRCLLFCDNFINLKRILRKAEVEGLSGVIFDLGVSLHQLTSRERGFSYTLNGPLDMRMNPREGSPLKEVIKRTSCETIERVLRDYGEEPYASSIAKRIFEDREGIQTTQDLVRVISKVVPRRMVKKSLARVFQAFRIKVNRELESLSRGLKEAIESLLPRARIVVISYHSLEDRIVKNTFKEYKVKGLLKLLTKKPLRPTPEEIRENPRSRSAKLRAAERL